MRTLRDSLRTSRSPSSLIIVLASNAILLITTLTLAYVKYHVGVGKYEEIEGQAGSRYPLDLPNILVTVEDTEKYAIYGSVANAEWVATTPASNGYIHVGEDHRFLALAFGHEFHCMRILRMAIAYPLHSDANTEHASHCLNYLRMYILCNPDLTLEKFDPLEADFTVRRFGATHVCRDSRLVYDELSMKRSEWLTLNRNGKNITG